MFRGIVKAEGPGGTTSHVLFCTLTQLSHYGIMLFICSVDRVAQRQSLYMIKINPLCVHWQIWIKTKLVITVAIDFFFIVFLYFCVTKCVSFFFVESLVLR